jgi:cytoskeletal protein CcmA (bactofilin family)
MEMRKEVIMSRMLRFLLLFVGAIMALVPAAVFAQDTANDGDLLLRIDGPVVVGPEETLQNVIVISDNATVDGTIESTLVVIDGDAVVSGHVNGDVTVVSGTLTLLPTAQVKNVSTFDGTLVREQGATVTGEITDSAGFTLTWVSGIVSSIFWAGMTLVVLLAGLVFAGVGGRQLRDTAALVVNNLGATLVAVVALWIVMPVLMVLSLATLFGIPLGFGYFVFVLPVLWFIGYLVAGTELGRVILRQHANDERPYLSALLGLGILQAVTWIPWIGWMFAALAGVIGSGALVLRAWRAWRGPLAGATTAPAPTAQPAPAA